MLEVDTQSVQRWFGELTGYPTCSECKGLIVDYRSSSSSSDDSNLSPLGSTPPLTTPTPERDPLRESQLNTSSGEDHDDALSDLDVDLDESLTQPTLSTDSPYTNQGFSSTSVVETTPTTGTKSQDDTVTPVTKRFNFDIDPSFQYPAEEATFLPGCCYYSSNFTHIDSTTNDNMSRLKDFYPGFIRKAPGPCSACRRVEGPHPTYCPGCTADYIRKLKENPPKPPGYVGKRPPFGLAGWRVARGHRHPKPVTLHSYGCFMQRKLNCYGGKNMNNFVHLGEPPTLLFNFRGCPQG